MTPAQHSPRRRRRTTRTAAVCAAAGLMGVALAACGGPASTTSTGSAKDAITAVIGYGNNQSWDPTQSGSAFSMAAFNNVYEPLVAGDPITRKPEPGLAAVPTDVTGTSVTFTLRDGAKWSDGQPVTADDVVFTYDRVLSPKDNVLIHPIFASWLDSVTKVDDRTVRFNLKYAFSYALQRVETAMILPKHVFDGHWDDAKAGKTLGSGPYKVAEQAPLDHTTFVKNDLYNGPTPAKYQKMVWKSIVDAAPRVAAISGASPEAAVIENVPPANASQLTQAGRQVDFVSGQNNVFLMFNTANKPFDNKLVRQALHYAIDKKKLVQVALKGAGDPATSYLNPALDSYQAAMPDYEYNPDRARQLLQQAGVSNLKITLTAANTSLVAESIKVIKEGWDAIGVDTTLDSQDTKALFSKLDGGQNFQVVATSGNPQQFGTDPDLLERFYYGPDSLFTGKYAHWTGQDAQSLFGAMDQAARDTDPAARTADQKKVLDTIADNAVLYPVVFTKLGTAWDPKQVSGVRAQGYPGINLLRVTPQ